MSHRNEPEIKQYTGFDRTFAMPFDRELDGTETLASVDDVFEMSSSVKISVGTGTVLSADTTKSDRALYANKAILVDIADLTCVVGDQFRIKFIGVNNLGKKIPLVGVLTII